MCWNWALVVSNARQTVRPVNHVRFPLDVPSAGAPRAHRAIVIDELDAGGI
jgi:hypothetical protein